MDPYALFRVPTKDAKVAYAGLVSTFILACAIIPFMHYTNQFETAFTLSLSIALSSTASPVLTRLITSLKIGKSDIGRLVIGAGMHSDFITTLVFSLGYIIYPVHKDGDHDLHPATFTQLKTAIQMSCALLFQTIVAATLSPIFMNWVNNENPEGKPLKGSHLVLSVAFMTLICCCSPVYGYSPILSAFMAGIFMPREGRVSKWVVSKINYLLTTLFYPIFFFWMGYEATLVDFEVGHLMTWARLFVLFGVATIGKVSGTIISGAMLGFNWPESIAIGLLLTTKGHFHIYLAIAAKTAEATSTSTTIVMIIAVFFTVVHAPSVVAQIIKRARKRAPTHRMALQLLDPSNELRILLCLHGPHNVPSTINFMEISRGSADPGIVVYVTDMIELTNEISATLVKGDGPDTVTVTDAGVVEKRNQVTSAVEAYVNENGDGITLRRMLALSTFSGLSQDVCILAEDLMVALIILPFHKTLKADGTLDGGNSGFRYVNRKVLRSAPCSVGILIDRGFGLQDKMSKPYVTLNVAVIFIGGKDDREALAYASRVARHPGVKLTVIRFLVDANSENAMRRTGNYRINIDEQQEETNLDDECFADFYERFVGSGHVSYMEKHLANSAETYSTLRSFEGQYSLIIVGRGGRVNSVLTFGMNDWQQCPELGPIGDVLSGRRICFCSLGFVADKAKNEFLDEIRKVEEFVKDPWGIRVREEKGGTIQVAVPRIEPPPPLLVPPSSVYQPVVSILGDVVVNIVDDEAAAAASAQAKRAALQRKAAAAMVAAEDYARRFESGDLAADVSRGSAGEEQGQSNVNVLCRICFFGENEGSERAKRMLSCKTCCKKYHRNCLKSWAQHRDLFHWSSWTCPSCRICEVCRRTGDPNKFMFCKRCDGAYHCYCQHPSHKNVSSGPYLCPKHTKCHSCNSPVPGNGLSVRWFLGYTCCDACGRLFVKGNYCPVCLKVYRDSESTPMVCCDVCQRWVHCQCDGISDEKYLQYQVDGNLQYKCATCRGECYQVKDLEDAVKELWRRKDKADRGLIASLRAAAGLPTQEDIFSISPYSDDEENGPVVLKNEHGRSLKLSLKGLVDKSPKKAKDYGKKYYSKGSSKKKYQASVIGKREQEMSFEGHNDAQSLGFSLANDKNVGMQSHKDEIQDTYSSPVAVSHSQTEEICSINQPGVLKRKFVDEVMVSDENRPSRVVRIKNNKSNDLDSGEDTGKQAGKSKTVKGKKLVINFGPRKINVTNSPRSDASTDQREPEIMNSNGTEDTSWRKTNDKKSILERHDGLANSGDERNDSSSQSKGLKLGREGNFIKLGKIRTGVPSYNPKVGRGSSADGSETATPEQTHTSLGKRRIEETTASVEPASEVPISKRERVYSGKLSEGRPDTSTENNDDSSQTPLSNSLPKDSKPLLRFKFKKPSVESQNSANQEEEKSSLKGQRSKRKRPSPFMEKTTLNADGATQAHQEDLMDEIMDANWILKKLGKDAIGKRVEVHQPSDNSWHKGVVADLVEGTSTLSVTLDDGRVKFLELGKQGVRFVSQKQKRSKT
uniref:Uncharacterized protein n=1 Tax=Cannabis sativa TaxID=3483 RepID=A0A803P3Q7_CANSA